GTYSSVSVKVVSPATRSGCARVTFAKRSTAMPALASPQARSLSGLLRPMVSSWSFGPEPASSTTPGAGACRVPCGTLSVPGTASGPSPTTTSCSVNVVGSAYGGGAHGAVGSAALAGSSRMPVIQPSASPVRLTATIALPRANVTGTLTRTAPGAGISVTGGPSAETGPVVTVAAC